MVDLSIWHAVHLRVNRNNAATSTELKDSSRRGLSFDKFINFNLSSCTIDYFARTIVRRQFPPTLWGDVRTSLEAAATKAKAESEEHALGIQRNQFTHFAPRDRWDAVQSDLIPPHRRAIAANLADRIAHKALATRTGSAGSRKSGLR